jgi:Rrf2 family protein
MAHIVNMSEAVSIALHGMVFITRSGSVVNVQEIADVTGSSRHHVAKIMQRLVKEGYLVSQRGPSGGFALKKKPEDITFLELYEIIEGRVDMGTCPFDYPYCPFEKCIFSDLTTRLTREFLDYMSNQTLDKYINFKFKAK